MLKLGWFSTGRGEGSRNLLRLAHEQIAGGDLPASIQFVFCNRDEGEAEGSDQFLDLVRSYGLPLVSVSSQRFRRERGVKRFADVRAEYDREVLERLEGYEPDLCVLAGYMLFTAAELCERFTLLNLHPAPPGGPEGTWQQVIWQLIDQRAQEAGAQVQLATMDWDRGPIITYCSFPLTGPMFDPLWDEVRGRSVDDLKASYWEEFPLFQRIRQEGLRREAPLLLETIRGFAEGSIDVKDRRIAGQAGRTAAGLCLNDKIEEWLVRRG
jgi:folate-dependent phosphoribosylglycinamide formyltransferase PurN